MRKQSPICPDCMGWMEIIGNYFKCRICGMMKKVAKREITPRRNIGTAQEKHN